MPSMPRLIAVVCLWWLGLPGLSNGGFSGKSDQDDH
jgi:hypothetical protein